MRLTRAERFEEFLRRLAVAPACASAKEALELIATTLNAVEDAFSGEPFRPDEFSSGGRLYPPQEDARRDVPGRPELRRYRSRGHNTYIGDDGAICIVAIAGGAISLDKPGASGRRVSL